MSEQENNVVPQLLQIVADIHEQTAGFEQQQHDSQQWYDRGYADGIVKALRALGYHGQLDTAAQGSTQEVDAISPHLPWGEAYHHGLRMGERETYEVLGPPDSV